MKSVLFDLDDTLYEYNPCHENGLYFLQNYLKEQLSIKPEDSFKFYKAGRDWVHKLLVNTAASHHRLLYMVKLCEFAGLNPIRNARTLEKIYWDAYFQKMVLRDGVTHLLESLKSRNITIAIVTDLVAEIQYAKLDYLGLTDLIDVVVTSEEAGIEKPAPKIFQLALEKLNAKASEAAFVGDSLTKDIQGASALGIKAFWINGDSEFSQNNIHVFNSFTNLEILLLSDYEKLR